MKLLSWKTWPYWVRGLALGTFLGVILSFVSATSFYGAYFYKYALEYFPGNCVINDFSNEVLCSFNPLFIVFSLVLGITFGLIYGKLKDKKIQQLITKP
jgi:hypothetical protein